MRLRFSAVVAPILATVLLTVMLVQTRVALRASGTWTRSSPRSVAAVDPYAPLDRLIATATNEPPPTLTRDPFALGPVAVAVPSGERPAPRPVVPPPPARPVLTSIVWDNDPRATIRWDGRDYSVRENALFADFRVVGISRDQVVLERGGERIVLALRTKGD